MKNLRFLVMLVLAACNGRSDTDQAGIEQVTAVNSTVGKSMADTLPPPGTSKVNMSKVIGWPDDKVPAAPPGFEVNALARDLESPRWIYVLPNGDILVAESKAGRITLIRDENQDSQAEYRGIFIDNLNRPFGMLLIGDNFYIAGQDNISVWKYQTGQTTLKGEGEQILELPAGGYNHHWTRNIIYDKHRNKILVSVGSASNAGEYGMDNERRRAGILEINPDGSGEVIFAEGIRNPVGMDIHPESRELWTVVNERDGLGDQLVPDYFTRVEKGEFFGWPWYYWGDYVDPRWEGRLPENKPNVEIPDFRLQSHVAPLGLTFYRGKSFPDKYKHGAFIGQHGSWNRSELVGYNVLFIPFENGEPAGPAEEFLTGFIADRERSRVYGRPVGVFTAADGSLLVADDAGGVVWRVIYK